MKGARLPLLAALCIALPGALPAAASLATDAEVNVCFNYGCLVEAPVRLAAADIDAVVDSLANQPSAADERAALARAVGSLFALAAQQTPIGADRPGNYDDNGVRGQMDCIDHSTNATRFLELLDARGALHFHEVLPRARRGLIFRHWAAHIATRDAREEFAVDSWYSAVGEPARVLPLAQWESNHD